MIPPIQNMDQKLYSFTFLLRTAVWFSVMMTWHFCTIIACFHEFRLLELLSKEFRLTKFYWLSLHLIQHRQVIMVWTLIKFLFRWNCGHVVMVMDSRRSSEGQRFKSCCCFYRSARNSVSFTQLMNHLLTCLGQCTEGNGCLKLCKYCRALHQERLTCRYNVRGEN